MFSTSSQYFLVSKYGESIESSKAHGLQLVEVQEDETTESEHNEEQEGTENHNESARVARTTSRRTRGIRTE